jgi:hypothetical protein
LKCEELTTGALQRELEKMSKRTQEESIVIGLLAPRLTPELFAERFLEPLTNAIPKLEPSHWGLYEPISNPYTGWHDAIHWDYAFLWRRKYAVKCNGSVFLGNRRAHGNIVLEARHEGDISERLKEFVESSAISLDAAFAYLHCVTDMESDGPTSDYDRWYPLSIGVTTHDLRKGIPELPWLTIFGPEYRSMIGEDTLGNLSAASSRALGPLHWEITVSNRLDDVIIDYARFFSERETIKREIGLKYFYRYDEIAAKKCAPEFGL